MIDRYHSYSLSDPGRRRANNEDSYLYDADLQLWAVADGMGGHEAGEVASAIAIHVLRDQIALGAPITDAIQSAHKAVLDAATEIQGTRGMGSTIVALSCHQNEWQLAWVGDSRAYLWTSDEEGGDLQQLSVDHSYVQMLFQSGAISEEGMEDHPSKHIVTQCLGSTELTKVKVDTLQQVWEPQQTLLLCSDGLNDELRDESIAQILCQYQDPAEAAEALLNAALAAGGKDNITVQLITSPLDEHQSAEKQSQTPNTSADRAAPLFRSPLLLSSLIIVFALALLWISK